jgi:hypothetical protein
MKFERSLNKFAASWIYGGRACLDLMLKQKQSRRLRRPAGSHGCKTNKRWWCVCADREHAQMLTLSCCSPLLEHYHDKPCPTTRCFSLRGKEGRLKLQDWRWRRHTLVRVGGDLLDWVSFTSWWPALVSGGASLAAFLLWLFPLRCSCMVVSLVAVMPHTVQVNLLAARGCRNIGCSHIWFRSDLRRLKWC